MFPWQRSQLFEEVAEGGEGGGGTATAVETAEQKELRELRETNAELAKSVKELSNSERAWSDRAARLAASVSNREAPAPSKEAIEEVIETGEQLLDDISKDGLAALKKRGFVSIKEVQALIDETANRMTGENRTEQQFQAVMSVEFPEMAADLARVERKQKPESELFPLAAEIYNEACELDESLRGSKSALVMATRQAAAQLQLAGKRKVEDKTDRDNTRRTRIEAQRPGERSGSEEPAEGELTAKQKQMAKDLGVSEKAFKAQQANIRGNRGK